MGESIGRGSLSGVRLDELVERMERGVVHKVEEEEVDTGDPIGHRVPHVLFQEPGQELI